jgi:hypothetical protein
MITEGSILEQHLATLKTCVFLTGGDENRYLGGAFSGTAFHAALPPTPPHQRILRDFKLPSPQRMRVFDFQSSRHGLYLGGAYSGTAFHTALLPTPPHQRILRDFKLPSPRRMRVFDFQSSRHGLL